MARYFEVHPVDPQPRAIRQIVDLLREDGVIAYPTDSCFALGCQVGNRAGLQRFRDIRGLGDRHHFTLVCQNFAQAGPFVNLSNSMFRQVSTCLPGPYTFILPATREVPRRLMHPRKRTVGIRVPDHRVVRAILAELGEPMVSTTLLLPSQERPPTAAWEVREVLDHAVDAIIDAQECGTEPTTVVDLSGDEPEVVRQGAGDASLFA